MNIIHINGMGATTNIRRSKHYPKDFAHYQVIKKPIKKHYRITVDCEWIGKVAFLTDLTECQIEAYLYDYAQRRGISHRGLDLVRIK